MKTGKVDDLEKPVLLSTDLELLGMKMGFTLWAKIVFNGRKWIACYWAGI